MDHFDTDVDIASAPLKFEDIVDKKSYDKMRPPKPEGKKVLLTTIPPAMH